MIALGAAIAAVVWIGLAMARLLAGPTLYDRVLAAQLMAIGAAVACAALAVLSGQSALVDAALGLVFGVLVLLLAVLKFFRARSFQPPLIRRAQGGGE